MKQSFKELAICGGPPAFAEPLHVGRPNIGDRQTLLARIDDILERRWLTNNGCYVQTLEQRLAEHLGVKHCLAVCNGTIGLEIAIRAAGLAGEVIVPALTFVATAHALQWLGLTPVFCDVALQTYNLDPAQVERLITPCTSAILAVHLWGRPAPIEALAEIARRHRLTLLFDAAHAFGCSHRGQMIGNFGRAEIFSFHATKFFNSLEGGAIATNDDEFAARVRLMRNFGFADFDTVVSVGTNGKMNEVSAAMGLTSLESLETFIATNQSHYHQYRAALANLPGVSVMAYDEAEQCNYQHIVLEIDQPQAGLSRDALLQILWAENILARRYFYPGCHRVAPYRSTNPSAGRPLPQTDRLLQRLLLLPTGTAVSASDIGQICRIIRLAREHARELPLPAPQPSISP